MDTADQMYVRPFQMLTADYKHYQEMMDAEPDLDSVKAESLHSRCAAITMQIFNLQSTYYLVTGRDPLNPAVIG